MSKYAKSAVQAVAKQIEEKKLCIDESLFGKVLAERSEVWYDKWKPDDG